MLNTQNHTRSQCRTYHGSPDNLVAVPLRPGEKPRGEFDDFDDSNELSIGGEGRDALPDLDVTEILKGLDTTEQEDAASSEAPLSLDANSDGNKPEPEDDLGKAPMKVFTQHDTNRLLRSIATRGPSKLPSGPAIYELAVKHVARLEKQRADREERAVPRRQELAKMRKRRQRQREKDQNARKTTELVGMLEVLKAEDAAAGSVDDPSAEVLAHLKQDRIDLTAWLQGNSPKQRHLRHRFDELMKARAADYAAHDNGDPTLASYARHLRSQGVWGDEAVSPETARQRARQYRKHMRELEGPDGPWRARIAAEIYAEESAEVVMIA